MQKYTSVCCVGMTS